MITQNQNNNAKLITISQRRLRGTIVEKNEKKMNEMTKNDLNLKYDNNVVFT